MKRLFKYVTLGIIMCLFCIGCTKDDTENGSKVEKKEESKNETGIEIDGSIISWANMKVDNPDLNLTEDQIEVLKYFDTDYFQVSDYDNLQRYPNVYENAQVVFPCRVVKTIKSDSEAYELLVSMIVNGMTGSDEENLIIITGKQQEPRLIEGDYISVYGRYQGIKQYDVDGKSLTKPIVTVNKTNKFYLATNSEAPRYEFDTINTVAKAIFGTDIKLKEEKADVDYTLGAMYSPQEQYFLVTPNNQSNANFSSFEMTSVNPVIRTPNPTAETVKEFHVSADFEHYIVSTFEQSTKMLYLEYYDREFKKVWGNEYSNVDTIPYDYTSSEIYLVADNDLHIIDTNTGKEKQDSVMVGEKVKVIMTGDGAILIGKGNKDNVMKVDSTGKTLWKTSVDIEVTDCPMIQLLNGNIVASLASYETDGIYIISGKRKFVTIDKDGNIIQEFIDWESQNDSGYTYNEPNEENTSGCLYYDPKTDVTHFNNGDIESGNHCL